MMAADPDGSRIGLSGLTQSEADDRLARDGHNELPQGKNRTALRILGDVLKEPMLALLLVGAILYLLFGDRTEALILMIFATFSVVITTVQELRTERLLETLRDLTSPRALVVRDNERRRIPGREVVVGDLIHVAEGDRVPADAVLLSGSELMADESLLTGESLAVHKRPAVGDQPLTMVRPGGADGPHLYSGTLVVRGSGLATVVATGPRSEIGRIGQTLAHLDTEPPRLRTETGRLVRIFGLLGGLAALAAAYLYWQLRGDWIEAGLAGIALGMALLPEEFPVVLTVFLAMGAWRISQARVLTRRATAIETLGAATVLCTDKTGTLTQNHMAVQEIRHRDLVLTPVEGLGHPLLTEAALIGLLASAPTAFDPMDTAFHDLARELGLRPGLDLAKTFGVKVDHLAVTQIWSGPDRNYIAACKGAPETVATLCRLSEDDKAALTRSVDEMAHQGMRVLGLARADLPPGAMPSEPRDLDFALVGLVGLADPLRPSVPDAVAECRTAGIRVVMITGDYPVTARAIAAQAGLSSERALTGDEIAALGADAFPSAIAATTIFSRILPEQKLKIVEALKAQGEIVAMTGDGVNDAPSLKAAHIGIAMGGRGTDVAREASSIVLLDDDFGSIVRAIRLGRRIYDNLKKAMGFILAVHIPIAGLALMPLALDLPIIFLPLHIAFLEMIIDPVCSLVFEAEPEEANTMRRPPRSPRAALFSQGLLLWSLVQGLAAFGTVAAIYLVAQREGLPANELRALTFFAVVLVIMALIYVNRTFSASPFTAFARPNRSLLLVPLAVAAALIAIYTTPLLSGLFAFGPLHGHDIAVGLGAAFVLFLVLEAAKLLLR
jgi:P-type Ca2+ transporter type 2C